MNLLAASYRNNRSDKQLIKNSQIQMICHFVQSVLQFKHILAIALSDGCMENLYGNLINKITYQL